METFDLIVNYLEIIMFLILLGIIVYRKFFKNEEPGNFIIFIALTLLIFYLI